MVHSTHSRSAILSFLISLFSMFFEPKLLYIVGVMYVFLNSRFSLICIVMIELPLFAQIFTEGSIMYFTLTQGTMWSVLPKIRVSK